VNPYAVKYSLGRACGFSVLTSSLWTGFWLHRTRRLFDGELARGRDDAAFHTVGLFVPVLNIFVIYWIYRDLDELRRRAGLRGIPVAGYVVGAIFAAPVVYSIALGQFNEYWDARTQGLATEAEISTPERALVALGAAWWLLSIVWMVLVVLSFFEVGPLHQVI
jgi:hypothetical protein